MCSIFSLFFDSILDSSVVCGGVRENVNSPFDRARRILSWPLLLRLWSPLWANPSGKYANPDTGYPTFITVQYIYFSLYSSDDYRFFVG